MTTVSALGSVYFGTSADQLLLSLMSLVNQTRALDEIVLVCDGPVPPDVDLVLSRFLGASVNLKVLRLPCNLGLGLALQHGLQHCMGDLVLRFDTDDINHLDRNKDFFRLFSQNPHLVVAGSFVEEFVTSQASSVTSILKSVPLSNVDIRRMILIRNPFNHPSVMFRRLEILGLGGYEHVPSFEDYFLWLKVARRSQYETINLSCPVVYMRRESLLDRRSGFDYFKRELFFCRKSLQRKLISLPEFIFFVLRCFVRLGFPPSLLLRLAMLWRDDSRLIFNPDLTVQ